MYYRLSNTAERERLEKQFDLPFRYPELYRRDFMINGFNEETLPIITSDHPDVISFGIWGILPHHFQEDWHYFQRITNTLYVNDRNFHMDSWYKPALFQRRCLILVTGFFAVNMRHGNIYPYYIGLASGNPICLAGIYNITDDGFNTCSFLTVKAGGLMKRIQNLGDEMPLILPGNMQERWVSKSLRRHEIFRIIETSAPMDLQAIPVPADIYKTAGVGHDPEEIPSLLDIDSANRSLSHYLSSLGIFNK